MIKTENIYNISDKKLEKCIEDLRTIIHSGKYEICSDHCSDFLDSFIKSSHIYYIFCEDPHFIRTSEKSNKCIYYYDHFLGFVKSFHMISFRNGSKSKLYFVYNKDSYMDFNSNEYAISDLTRLDKNMGVKLYYVDNNKIDRNVFTSDIFYELGKIVGEYED